MWVNTVAALHWNQGPPGRRHVGLWASFRRQRHMECPIASCAGGAGYAQNGQDLTTDKAQWHDIEDRF